MKYYFDQISNMPFVLFQERNKGPLCQVGPSTEISWGGKDSDSSYEDCICWIQYVRLYLDWTADSADKMISLALMNSNGISR